MEMMVGHNKMNQAGQIADRIRHALRRVPTGSLRFWGEWFGRPYDNLHKVVDCRAEENVLRLFFDQCETLAIWSPEGLTIDRATFRISDADRVRWEWFYYGRPQRPENLCFEDLIKSADGISASSNVDRYTRVFHPTKAAAAVEILSPTP